MREGLYLGRLTMALIVRDDSLILPVGMKFATEKPAAFHQHTSGLRKYGRKVSDVLEDEITGDQISRLIVTGPAVGNVCNGETDIIQLPEFGLRLLYHTVREI